MIKLFSLKQQKKEEESAGGTKGSSKKASAAQLRIQKDINELNLPKTCEIDFSDQDNLLNFKLVICPDEGFYKGGKFVFSFKVSNLSLFSKTSNGAILYIWCFLVHTVT
ncbi:NEDD8-conjugating enzyme Ubc12-like [Protobothrops mucrosquamatus]|uniref:NEDD8-conjugating enzyme Ubc12-like n=1 Tax=Protobothrops mucrosquamatus TaxID=103944 RepID=UPI000775BD62|nr:NEDD8-conjugating enzyme Ubc12-like [Protobothrops mucrosquamatus]